jgi:hypothetical protein
MRLPFRLELGEVNVAAIEKDGDNRSADVTAEREEKR